MSIEALWDRARDLYSGDSLLNTTWDQMEVVLHKWSGVKFTIERTARAYNQ